MPPATEHTLATIDSLTKYPSIPVLHALDQRGRAVGDRCVDYTGPVLATRKYDGANVRVILIGDDFLIGYREQLIYAKGDRIKTADTMGTLDVVLPIATALRPRGGHVTIVYMEVCGGSIGKAARRYTSSPADKITRVFDLHEIPQSEWDSMIQWTPTQASTWRDSLAQSWATRERISSLGLPVVECDECAMPVTPDDVRGLLAQLAPNEEGLVLRTADRRMCVKIRHENYRTPSPQR